MASRSLVTAPQGCNHKQRFESATSVDRHRGSPVFYPAVQDWCVHSHFRSMSTFGDFFFAFLATLHGQPHTNVNRELEYVYRAQGLSRARASLQERCWKRATACCTKWKMLRLGRTPFAVSDSPELVYPWSLRSMGGTEGPEARPLARAGQHQRGAMDPRRPAEVSLAQVEPLATRATRLDCRSRSRLLCFLVGF